MRIQQSPVSPGGVPDGSHLTVNSVGDDLTPWTALESVGLPNKSRGQALKLGGPTKARPTEADQAAISRQVFAHRRHISAHFFICASSPKASQAFAQRSQASAQSSQVRPCSAEFLIMKSALVWHRSTQS